MIQKGDKVVILKEVYGAYEVGEICKVYSITTVPACPYYLISLESGKKYAPFSYKYEKVIVVNKVGGKIL